MNTLPIILTIAATAKRGIWLPLSLLALFDDDYPTAAFVAQLAFWQSVSTRSDLWVVRTYQQWYDETRITRRKLERVVSNLRDEGLIETKLARSPYHAMQPVLHYRLIEAALSKKWNAAHELLENATRAGMHDLLHSDSPETLHPDSPEMSHPDSPETSHSYINKRIEQMKEEDKDGSVRDSSHLSPDTTPTPALPLDPFDAFLKASLPALDRKLGGAALNPNVRDELNDLREFPLDHVSAAWDLMMQQELRQPRAAVTYVRRICENWRKEGKGRSGVQNDEEVVQAAQAQLERFRAMRGRAEEALND